MTTYVTASLGGLVALVLILFSLYIFIKYRCVLISIFSHIEHVVFRMERQKKKHSIENAHRVASWTKKVMIERQISGNEPLLVPDVRIKKVRIKKSDWKDMEECSDGLSEYEFQEDSDWEVPRELLELDHTLGEGAF